MEVTSELVTKAYLFAKSYAYHDNLNLFLKKRVAAFECAEFDDSIENIVKVINDDKPLETVLFSEWCSNLGYHLLPKSVHRQEDRQEGAAHGETDGLFISNVTFSDRYEVDNVNYLIDAPVELHIIESLWCLFAGVLLDSELSSDCYGNRVSDNAMQLYKSVVAGGLVFRSGEIFKRYIEQYGKWRDTAIDTATALASENEDVAIFSLDLKSYFYNVDLNLDEIEEELVRLCPDGEVADLVIKLTHMLGSLFSQYQAIISDVYEVTHAECIGKAGLPIGLASSSILANWYLKPFDDDVTDLVRPAYYGRYVDDVLMVFKRPKIDNDSPIESMVSKYLSHVLTRPEDREGYQIVVGSNKLPIQKNKLILQYFDKNHSMAGLEVFKKELEERSSAFKFLPSDHIDADLEKFAYDVLYNGSANKLRSIVGLAENETELARFISSHILAHRLCKIDKEHIILPQIEVFFRGVSALKFSRLWEKVYQYAVILGREQFVVRFYKAITEEVNKIEFVQQVYKQTENSYITLTNKIIQDLHLYNDLSLSLCLGLLDVAVYKRLTMDEFSEIGFDGLLDLSIEQWPQGFGLNRMQALAYQKNMNALVRDFRCSNMIRHHLVAWPMANFTRYEGDLTNEKLFVDSEDNDLSDNKVAMSPRFIHFDEWQAFSLIAALRAGMDLSEWHAQVIEGYKEQSYWDEFPVQYQIENRGDITSGTLVAGDKKSSSKLRVALANMRVYEDDIAAAMRKDKKPNVSFERQAKLYQILNDAVRDGVEMLVIPEVAIPVSWLPFMVSHARRNQIGIVFGLEHWVVDDCAYNLLIEALPFKISGKYNSCVMTARLKNHYAPDELEMIESLRLRPADKLLKKPNYHKVKWNGVSFATYNCFELSDINHRTLFKSEVDMLTACVWNKDTNYYQHILESAVRDLHCYVIQSNTSQYGGSCVLRPTNTERKTMLYVKGGDNSCALTTDVDIQSLRDFQFKSKASEGDYFKPLPPGYDSDKVLDR